MGKQKSQRPANATPDTGNGAPANDAKTASPPPDRHVRGAEAGQRVRGRRLRTLTHVKGGLAATIRELEAGRLEPKRGNALVYAYSTLANVMGADVAKDLAELREMLTELGKGSGTPGTSIQ